MSIFRSAPTASNSPRCSTILGSSPSMKSMEPADYATECEEEAQQVAEAGEVMMKDMPLGGPALIPSPER
jgi:hypothetical protein